MPIVRQATFWSCGPAALLSVLFYWRVYDGNESSLYADLGTTPEQGTSPRMIARVGRTFGLQAQMRSGMTVASLRAALVRGDTVILDIQAWHAEGDGPPCWRDEWEDGHYLVLVGMDRERVYVMDPAAAGGYGWFFLSEIEDRWHDYEVVGGRRVEWRHLGIVIRGRRPLRAPSLIRVA